MLIVYLGGYARCQTETQLFMFQAVTYDWLQILISDDDSVYFVVIPSRQIL